MEHLRPGYETSIPAQFDTLTRANRLLRFTLELSKLPDTPENEQRRQQLKTIINCNQPVSFTSNRRTFTTYLDIVDKSQYQKEWKRLKPDQQRTKFIEYLDTLKLDKPQYNEFVEAFTAGKIQQKSVNYNYTKCIIESITQLTCDNANKWTFSQATKHK